MTPRSSVNSTVTSVARPRLGQLLEARGWITPDQLRRALADNRQGTFRIGSRLLELQALSEDRLLQALADQLHVPVATAEDLRRIPPEVLALLPGPLAQRCRAIPFRHDGSQLSVALLEVDNLLLHDELSFATGQRIRPFIANEARIYEALERYYGFECPSRFSNLLDQMNRTRYLWTAIPSAAPPAAGAGQARSPSGAASAPLPVRLPPPRSRPTAPPAAPSGAKPGSPPPAPASDLDTAVIRPRRAAPPGQAAGPRPEPQPTSPAAQPRTSGPHAAGAQSAAQTRPPHGQPPVSRPPLAQKAPTPVLHPRRAVVQPAEAERRASGGKITPDLAFLARHRLRTASSREDVGRALLAYLAHHFDRIALMSFQPNRVEGWMGAGAGLDFGRLQRYRLSLRRPSIFLNLDQGAGFHYGPLLEIAPHRGLLACWQDRRTATECAVIPVRLRDRTVLAIYGDRIRQYPEAVDLAQLRELAAEAAEAFARYLVVRKRDLLPSNPVQSLR